MTIRENKKITYIQNGLLEQLYIPNFIDWAFINAFNILFILCNCFDVNNRHGRKEFFIESICYCAHLYVPASALHKKPVDIGSFTRCRPKESRILLFSSVINSKVFGFLRKLFLPFLGYVTVKTHSIEGPLILARSLLHNGGKK